MADESKLSSVEKIKAESNYLRGNLAAELANDQDGFEKDTVQLIKHHGMYQQDNRDQRVSKADAGKKSGKQVSLMVRVKITGGRLTSDQLLAQLDLCDELGNGTMRLTDRQDIQFHGILKKNVKATIQRINEVELTTFGGCGDVERNVLCCPAPLRQNGVREEMQATARRLAALLLPRTSAYHEIWMNQGDGSRFEKVSPETGEVEPLYGKTYLPRKFKTAMALPEDNCTDIHANDLGFLAIVEGGEIVGYNMLAGGGFGMTPSNKNTFPALSHPVAFLEPDQVDDAAVALVKLQRDHGNRADRKRARLKYVIADWGVERFKATLDEYYGRKLPPARPAPITRVDDHMGWYDQGDGRWFYGLNVENGRVLDREGFTLKAALREICRTLKPGLGITAQQSLLFTDLAPEARPVLDAILQKHGIRRSEDFSTVRRWAMACVALPTCPLAVTESERMLPTLIDHLEVELAKLGLQDEVFTLRATGCPNGCARTYCSDIALVGKTAGKYTIYLGGRLLGDRLAYIFKEIVPHEDVVPTLVALFTRFKNERQPGERVGDFFHRLGREALSG